MTGQMTGRRGDHTDFSLESLDEPTAESIRIHLDRALVATDGDTKDFHLRHAQQLLEAATES